MCAWLCRGFEACLSNLPLGANNITYYNLSIYRIIMLQFPFSFSLSIFRPQYIPVFPTPIQYAAGFRRGLCQVYLLCSLPVLLFRFGSSGDSRHPTKGPYNYHMSITYRVLNPKFSCWDNSYRPLIHKPIPFQGLNIRIPITIPIKGRGVNQGSSLPLCYQRGSSCYR